MLTTSVLVDDKKNVSSICWFGDDFGNRNFDWVWDEHNRSGWGQQVPDDDRRIAGVSGGEQAEGRGIAGAGEFERAGEFAGRCAEGRGYGRIAVRLAKLGPPIQSASRCS